MINPKYQNQTIVFFGDSITDSLKNYSPNHSHGYGYVSMVNSYISCEQKHLNIKIINEGIGGNKTTDLISRFNGAIIKNAPNLTFLMIGINDIWHPYDVNESPSITNIINNINHIVTNIKNTGSKIVLMMPFLFPNNDHFNGLMPYFNKLINEIEQYSKSNNIPIIDTYQILKQYDIDSLTIDSIHPTIFGHGIIAQSVIDYLSK